MTVLAARPHRTAATGLGLLLVLGSLVLWLGIPVAWLWTCSQLMSEYPLIWAAAVFGCPVTMGLWALALTRLNGAYLRASGADPEQQRSAWLHSSSGERGVRRPSGTLLDASLTASVILALLAVAIWFFFFAENYSPGRIL